VADEKHGGSVFNGTSLSTLTGAVPTAKVLVEVRLPASSIHEVLETIHRLGYTGQFTLNCKDGKVMDTKWSNSRQIAPPDV
jgi:hypothetical protein